MGEMVGGDRERPDPPAKDHPPAEAGTVPSPFVERHRQAVDERLRDTSPPVAYLFSPAQAFVATLLFSTLGGSVLVALNFKRLGRVAPAWGVLLLGYALAPAAGFFLHLAGDHLAVALFGALAIWVASAFLVGFFVHVNHGAAQGEPLGEASWEWAILLPLLWSIGAPLLTCMGYFLLRTPPMRGAW